MNFADRHEGVSRLSSYQAIAAACEGVLQVLRSNYRPDLFGQTELDFRVYTAKDFSSPMQAGVSLFLYQVRPGEIVRQPMRRGAGGSARPALQLDLHFMLTFWGRDASLQHVIAGWAMRCLEDTPVLSSSLLNATWPGVFRGEESLEVLLEEVEPDAFARIWERLSERGYNLSVPYVARFVRIESGVSGSPMPVVGQSGGS